MPLAHLVLFLGIKSLTRKFSNSCRATRDGEVLVPSVGVCVCVCGTLFAIVFVYVCVCFQGRALQFKPPCMGAGPGKHAQAGWRRTDGGRGPSRQSAHFSICACLHEVVLIAREQIIQIRPRATPPAR